MKDMFKIFAVVFSLSLFASGCARMPEMSVHYYLPVSKLHLEVIRTVTCDDRDNLLVASTVVPTVSHMADRSAPKAVSVDKLDDYLSVSNLQFTFYEDGRLKSINTTSTGQGESIFKNVISLAQSAAGLDPGLQPFYQPPLIPRPESTGKPENGEPRSAECQYISARKNSTLTLRFEGSIDPKCSDGRHPCTLDPREESKIHLNALKGNLGKVGEFAVYETYAATRAPTTQGSSTDASVLLALNAPSDVTVKVVMGKDTDTEDSWSGTFVMALPGSDYGIPIPKASVFGKQTFSLAVAPSGAVTELGYVKDAGVAQGIGVGQNLIDTFGPRAAALERLAILKTEADLIAAQQRLVRCRADPATCK